MPAYYNEHNPFAAEWLRNLIHCGVLPAGDVDTRDIQSVQADELRGYSQCHFFAGIGGWPHALRLARWPDELPVWTGSAPCQPFSVAGKGLGTADDRHLWPYFFRLVEQCRPSVCFGEQVAGPAGLAWLDLVFADLEGADYACGAADLSAAGVGAPHIRQRLYWVAHALPARRAEGRAGAGNRPTSGRGGVDGMANAEGRGQPGRMLRTSSRLQEVGTAETSHDGRMANTDSRKCGGVSVLRGDEHDGADAGRAQGVSGASACCEDGRMVQPDSTGRNTGRSSTTGARHGSAFVAASTNGRTNPLHGVWGDADWLLCRDARWRPVESGTFPLAHGIPNRVDVLRAYGNAIVPQVAAEFIQAYMTID